MFYRHNKFFHEKDNILQIRTFLPIYKKIVIFFSGHIVLFKENYSEKYMGRGKKMSKVLFLNIPSHGHINPTLGLVEGLALNKDKNSSWVSKRYAYFLKELKGKEKAYSYYEQLFVENPYNYNYYINAAELAFISNDIEKSLRYLEKANSINKPKVMEIILRFYWAIYYIALFKK